METLPEHGELVSLKVSRLWQSQDMGVDESILQLSSGLSALLFLDSTGKPSYTSNNGCVSAELLRTAIQEVLDHAEYAYFSSKKSSETIRPLAHTVATEKSDDLVRKYETLTFRTSLVVANGFGRCYFAAAQVKAPVPRKSGPNRVSDICPSGVSRALTSAEKTQQDVVSLMFREMQVVLRANRIKACVYLNAQLLLFSLYIKKVGKHAAASCSYRF